MLLRISNELSPSESLQRSISHIDPNSQRFWYDHPIQLGVPLEGNEVIYGLRGLQNALDFERQRGNINHDNKLTCLLSVSVTHDGITGIAKAILEEQFAQSAPFENLEVYLFTESDTKRIIDEILKPAAKHYLQQKLNGNAFSVFGVDGAYGRHYSFLKAISAFWSILIDPQIKATFKIDLDQVFPQSELLAETGISAFEHFQSPLWGAKGYDTEDNLVELGMIAGALVNERDIDSSLFTADVSFPDSEQALSPDEYVFFSTLPQALSTRAEMMSRYGSPQLDGVNSLLTAYSRYGRHKRHPGRQLAQVQTLYHQPSSAALKIKPTCCPSTQAKAPGWCTSTRMGLIMRHDKEAFAQDAIQSAHVGKLIGDYERILYFSAYARAISNDIREIKNKYDPFTGGFISHIPITLTLLRFCLKAESLFAAGQGEPGPRICQVGDKARGNRSRFRIWTGCEPGRIDPKGKKAAGTSITIPWRR